MSWSARTTQRLIATRHATSLQTPFPHMRMRAPSPPNAHTMPTPHASHLGDFMVFKTMRQAASLRSSNNCKCLIETFFIARGEKPPPQRIELIWAFFCGSPFGIRRFKTDSPRSSEDVATRRAASLSASTPFPVDARMGVNDGRCGNPQQCHPRKCPTVGAGSSRFSRRFPRPPYSPYAKIPPPVLSAALECDADV